MLSVFIFGIASFADEKSGAHIYKEVCSACHEKGVVNAPKLGDQTAWGKLISEGQVIITAQAMLVLGQCHLEAARKIYLLSNFLKL